MKSTILSAALLLSIQLDEKIDQTQAAIDRLEQRVDSILKKIEYLRRRVRGLCKLRAEELTMKLPLE